MDIRIYSSGKVKLEENNCIFALILKIKILVVVFPCSTLSRSYSEGGNSVKDAFEPGKFHLKL